MGWCHPCITLIGSQFYLAWVDPYWICACWLRFRGSLSPCSAYVYASKCTYPYMYIRYVFRNTYFRRSLKPAKVHGSLFIEANSVFNLGMTWVASEKTFLITWKSIRYYFASEESVSALSINKCNFFLPLFYIQLSMFSIGFQMFWSWLGCPRGGGVVAPGSSDQNLRKRLGSHS